MCNYVNLTIQKGTQYVNCFFPSGVVFYVILLQIIIQKRVITSHLQGEQMGDTKTKLSQKVKSRRVELQLTQSELAVMFNINLILSCGKRQKGMFAGFAYIPLPDIIKSLSVVLRASGAGLKAHHRRENRSQASRSVAIAESASSTVLIPSFAILRRNYKQQKYSVHR
jgi:hypothetical protein